jgi:hypothetical protein
MEMTAVGLISDTEAIVKAYWLLFHHDGAAAFKLAERSPLPPALSAKDRSGGRTQILNVCWIPTINHHPVKSDEDSAPESISDTEDWLNWNGDLDNPNDSADNCAVDVQSDVEHDIIIKDRASPLQHDVSAVPNVRGMIQPTRMSKRHAEKVLAVNAIETRMDKGVKKK